MGGRIALFRFDVFGRKKNIVRLEEKQLLKYKVLHKEIDKIPTIFSIL